MIEEVFFRAQDLKILLEFETVIAVFRQITTSYFDWYRHARMRRNDNESRRTNDASNAMIFEYDIHWDL